MCSTWSHDYHMCSTWSHDCQAHLLKADFDILVAEILDVVMVKGVQTLLLLWICRRRHASFVIFPIELELKELPKGKSK